MDAAVEDVFEPQERPSLERIEERRAELERSSDLIVVRQSEFSDDAADGSVRETKLVGETCKRASVGRSWGLLLYSLVRKLNPRRCIELGTCLGISTAYLAAGLEANGVGELLSGEGSAAMLTVAAQTLSLAGTARRVELVHGRFEHTLPEMIGRLGGVDFAFIDGHHDHAATIEYFDTLAPSLAPGAVAVFDDIRWSEGMYEAWQTVSSRPTHRVAIDLGRMGVLAIGRGLNG